MDPILRKQALDYHEFPTPGKISILPTKQLTNQRDLALAYSPVVAAACLEIAKDPINAFKYTARGNLVGGHHQWHGGLGPGRHWSPGGQASHGGQGRAL